MYVSQSSDYTIILMVLFFDNLPRQKLFHIQYITSCRHRPYPRKFDRSLIKQFMCVLNAIIMYVYFAIQALKFDFWYVSKNINFFHTKYIVT